MTYTQVSNARKFVIAAFSGVVALSLMLPTQMAFADYKVGDKSYSGTENANGNGAEGGTWKYTAEGQQMALVDYVGDTIRATDQDLNVQLEGDNTVSGGGIRVENGDLTITGDDSVYGEDKPSLTVEGDGIGRLETAGEGQNDITIKDANIYADGASAGISASGNLTVTNSGIYRTKDNKSFFIETYKGHADSVDMTLQGSEIEATHVYSSGEMTIDNTNLTVVPNKDDQAKIDAGTYGKTPWVVGAVHAAKGITLKGEANGEVVKYTDKYGDAGYYLSTGDDNKVELKASATPAYYGPTKGAPQKGMPQTSDTTMPMVLGLSIVAACAAAFTVFSARSRKAENEQVK